MATLSNPNDLPLDAREQLARINQMHAMIEQALVSAAEARQEMRFGPFTLAFAGMGALAAFFAGGVAFAKVFLG